MNKTKFCLCIVAMIVAAACYVTFVRNSSQKDIANVQQVQPASDSVRSVGRTNLHYKVHLNTQLE